MSVQMYITEPGKGVENTRQIFRRNANAVITHPESSDSFTGEYFPNPIRFEAVHRRI